MTTCWTLTETGLRGTENQCLALAEAAGYVPELKRIRLRQPWKTLTPWLRHFSLLALTPDSSQLAAPWPEVLIASGRKAIAAALWVKKQNKGRTKLVIVQSPVIKSRYFDLVVVPRHDTYDGPNVVKITGALSLVTAEKLAVEKEKWAAVLCTLPDPRLAVLIGGNSRAHAIDDSVADRIIAQLQKLLADGYSLMVTVSRRTPAVIADRMRQCLSSAAVHFWDGSGDNPYQAYLAWADVILVTEDSVSMASEAVSTGKPVYIVRLTGGTKRFRRFHDHLLKMGYVRWFDGTIEINQRPQLPNELKTMTQRLQQLDR